MAHAHAPHTPVQSATTAGAPASDDQGRRIRHYLISMGIRTVCFVLAIVCSGWLRWVFAAGAVVIPYLAVVFANAVGPRDRGTMHTPPPPDTERIGARTEQSVLSGRVLDRGEARQDDPTGR